MTGRLLPTVRTPLDPPALRSALESAWRAKYGACPPRNAVAVLMAQAALETGLDACWCWNIGNVKAGKGQDYCELAGVWEVVDGKRVDLPKGAPGTQFRAFASLEEGARAHLDVLARRFAKAWPAVLAADPGAFAGALKAQGYYTAPLADYRAGMLRWFDTYADPPLVTNLDVADALARLGYADARAFQAAVGLTADGIVGPKTRAALRAALNAEPPEAA
jgi:hypothetical protein